MEKQKKKDFKRSRARSQSKTKQAKLLPPKMARLVETSITTKGSLQEYIQHGQLTTGHQCFFLQMHICI